MAMNYEAFKNEIETLLNEMGSDISVSVPEQTGKSSTGKKVFSYTDYSGIAVMGKYDSEYITSSQSVIHAGDTKFVCMFDDTDFEPVNNKDMTITFGSKKYKIINVDAVSPSADPVIIYIIQARRVN